MGIEHVAAVWESSPQTGSSLLVLLAIASYSDHNGEWRIDQATLQTKARLRRRRVQEILDELVASGELAVVSHHGRGRFSTYRIQVGEKARPGAPFSAPQEAATSPEAETKGAAERTFPAPKGAVERAFPEPKGAPERTFPAPLCPPFPPDPQFPLNSPQNLETFGLRPLSGPQGTVSRVNLLLAEAGVPLPTPAQIGVWSKTLGGPEPLLELLARLVQAGLATKKIPAAYIHRIVLDTAARPAPARPRDARAGRDLLWAAGADETRWQQALEIIADTEES